MPEKPAPVSDRPIGQEESLAKSLQDLTNPNDANVDFHTELDDEEIQNLAALKIWSKTTGFDILENFCLAFERLRVSRFRQGRREIALTIGLSSGGQIRGPKSIRDLLGSIR